ncbi:GntR family transcriptional regulator [Microbacterium invictum]|uniref:DNA-binding GntR family transcriptional regulator n=1 Tax=Microbacterium invictum TaxID=515415 RepID=A0AA40VLY3_9MICO|nr:MULTISPECIES: GntR family transcriptional regulator [Microbacterium]MBB4139859.1 DNA-binding GntR family transcriptional regulator [Microbacterium invictum]
MSTVETAGSKSQHAYTWIRDRIQGHAYSPGYRLVLGSIADELGMSVVPVREAIRRLEAEGLVTFERNVGARVSVVDEDQYVFTMQTLSLVEGYATSLAAPVLTAADLDHAAQINDRMDRMIEHFDAHAFTQLNQQFHQVLYAPCPNPHILELVDRSWSRLSGLRDTSFAQIPDRPRHSVQEHAQILELIRTRADPTEIELATRTHRLRTLDAFLAARHPDASHH